MQPVFIDFEASSLSPASWPIEVGIARVDQGKVLVDSKLIRPHQTWSMSEWHEDSAAIHGISLDELADAEPAEDVARWLADGIAGELVLSDAPEFDQRWLDRLMSVVDDDHGIELADFDEKVWQAFSQEYGTGAAGRIHTVYKAGANRQSTHRAGADAADLAHAWLAGCS
ncbi:exonuclease domain-containing protein [Pseudophaeobacter sp. C1-32P7]|uniref:3'-5' exonuclease n=1 Tax=Pseudophaeobacter sp. C1-32P7 TaxID=3098142 RepID=UPI0034D78097